MNGADVFGRTEEFQQDLAVVGAKLRDVTVVISDEPTATRQSPFTRGVRTHGSGIIWGSDLIVTNAHVAVSNTLMVTYADGERLHAKVLVRDKRHDLAALRVDNARSTHRERAAALIGEPSALRTGALVLANGHPLGVEHSLAMGVVHSAPTGRANPYISADIRLAPGNSGGPLADASGRVIGVNSMIVGGLGVAVSTDAVRAMLRAATPRPSLGVQLRAVRVRVPAGSAKDSVGLLVIGCEPSGTASRAGLMLGDVLLGHAGRPFRSPSELAQLLKTAGSDGELRLDVGRANKQISITVRLGDVQQTFAGGRRAA